MEALASIFTLFITMTVKEAYSRAATLCSKSEKCIADIRQKLYDWQLDADCHEEVIEALVEHKYIDEERYARYFARDKYRFNTWGKIKIRHHLSYKKIPSSLIDQALAEIDEEDYMAGLRHALEVKKRSLRSSNDYDGRQKLMRFAAGRGFSMDEIQHALENLTEEEQ